MQCRRAVDLYTQRIYAYVDKLRDNIGAYSEEQGERYHQDIMKFEREIYKKDFYGT